MGTETFNRIRLGADFNTVTKNIFLIENWRKEYSEFGKVPALSLNVTLMKENISELPTILKINIVTYLFNSFTDTIGLRNGQEDFQVYTFQFLQEFF